MSSNLAPVIAKPRKLSRQVQKLHSDYAEMRIDLNEFEAKVLVPDMLGRSKYLLERLTEMKRTCEAKETLEFLEPALKAVIPPVPDGSSDNAAAKYLVGTARVIEESYLAPLQRIQSEYATVNDTAKLLRLLNDVHIICGSITQSEKTLFRYRVAVRAYVTNKQTGKVIVGEPQELDIILAPFRHALDELKQIAEATEGTIQHWKQQLDAAKKPFLEYLTASTNAATSRRSIVVQLLAIVLAISFSTFFLSARDPFSLRKENVALKAELVEERAEVQKLRAQVSALTAPTATGAVVPSPSAAPLQP